LIYFDNNASTRVDQRVLDAMLPWFRDHWGNPANNLHQEGRRAREAVRSAQEEIGGLLRCRSDEIVFTSGASEANALAIMGGRPAGALPVSIVTSTIEHSSIWALALRLESRGIILSAVEPNGLGFVSCDCLDQLDVSENSLVTLQWVNSETGIINDLAEIADFVKARGGLLHIDAAQGLGKVPIDLSKCPIDLLTISAHKICGPKGVGALFVRKGVMVDPLIIGGSPRGGLHPGTPNVPGAVGFGEACRILRLEAEEDNQRISVLRDHLEAAILAGVEDTIVVGGRSPRVCNTSMLGWSGLDNREIGRELDQAGICVGSGAACSTEDPFGSRSLRALKVPEEVIPSCIRFSLGKENTVGEVADAAHQVVKTVKGLRTP
jgi:cysteine desulfurase